MGYLIGSQFKLAEGTNEEFRKARASQFNNSRELTEVPIVTPQRSTGNLANAQARRLVTAGVSDVTRTAPIFNDPRYTSSTLSIPTDDRTLHGLYRFFAETDPIVGASLKLLSDLPLADLTLGQCEDSGVQQHYEDMWERINGIKLLSDITQEYYEIGNVYPFGAFNEADYMWDQFALLNPDYVKIESTWINAKPLIKLIPDETLKRVVHTQSPRYIYDQLPEEMIQYVLFNQEIPLEPNNVFHVAHAMRPYELKGRSLIKRILKTLMLEDRFNQANFALATRHAVPLTIVKVGDPASGWIPKDEEINAVRDLFGAYELDPNFSIFYHYGINVEYYGSNGKMLPIGPELDRIYRLKFIGMGVHEQLLAGQGGSYSQAYINLEVQRQRYLNLQLKLETLVHQGWFKPVADLCGFYRVKQAVAGYGGVTKSKWGSTISASEAYAKNFKSLRDFQDNAEFQKFTISKTAENKGTVRDYVYPKLDWGALSAASDENLKNYIKWLTDKRPHLVDDGTLARLAKLDRDTQEKAYISDLRRAQQRTIAISKEGLLPFVDKKTGGGAGDGGFDLGGLTGADFNGGTIPIGDTAELGIAEGGPPPSPIGEAGAPEAANGNEPAVGLSSLFNDLSKEVYSSITEDDMYFRRENHKLSTNHVNVIKNLTPDQKQNFAAIIKEIDRIQES